MRVQSFIIVMALPLASASICFGQISDNQSPGIAKPPSIVKSTGRPQTTQNITSQPTTGATGTTASNTTLPASPLLGSKPPEVVRRPVAIRTVAAPPVAIRPAPANRASANGVSANPAVDRPAAVGQPAASTVQRVSHEQSVGASSPSAVAPAVADGGRAASQAPIAQVVDIQPPTGKVPAQAAAASRSVQLQALVPLNEQPTVATLPKAGTDDGLLLLQPILPRTGVAVAPSAEAANIPFEVLQMTRLTGTSTDMPLASPSPTKTLSTESMIGPLGDPSGLFGKLNTTPVPAAEPLSHVRTQMGQVQWAPDMYTWVTPVFYHKPLYFEQPNLERYGIGTYRWLQPAASSAHFFSSIALMPYKVMTQHPQERVYTLGYDRPGNCAAYQGRPLLGQSTVGEACKVYDPYSGY